MKPYRCSRHGYEHGGIEFCDACLVDTQRQELVSLALAWGYRTIDAITGYVMRALRGRDNPALVRQEAERQLKGVQKAELKARRRTKTRA